MCQHVPVTLHACWELLLAPHFAKHLTSGISEENVQKGELSPVGALEDELKMKGVAWKGCGGAGRGMF